MYLYNQPGRTHMIGSHQVRGFHYLASFGILEAKKVGMRVEK